MEITEFLTRTATGNTNISPIKTSVHMNTSEENYVEMVMTMDSKITELKSILQTIHPMKEEQYKIASEVTDVIVRRLSGKLKDIYSQIKDKVPKDQPWMLETMNK